MTTRVLIVEDHADSAEFLRLLLEPEGYLVKTAATAQHTREEVAAWKPDIILMDLMLPDVEGLDLLRELRTMNPDSQVIVVSGHGSISVAVEAMENGALSFIEKPLNPERADGATPQGRREARADRREPPAPRRTGRGLDATATSSGAASRCASCIS